ncbi:hypothetical protein BBO99_00009438 [Phytophthora kernoviae]|uniref:Uncharacterized protein n=2 Tax=Phytophthora kernoviae TaxID=325452 RepID=A0A3R7J2B2_9STRA|nr:hypothetical protein G195_011327 [Phytophthora kernoviae 00238/432]KAG2503028.1 hypothetical protein JM16_009474 [Phytophthora kernoviae]KAG2508049.1 hypothetical protein JM18_009247 [Phytophthora kernoviae]RLN20896.1 hypothetical protein BBI17_009402 [Phytophthora kernoviae]RLN73395.1 hypothetical protein BBO99_00009438 [Phytophthora kernoviae]
MKPGYKWFEYLMPSSYSLPTLVDMQFGDDQDIIAVTVKSVTTKVTVADYIKKTYDFRPDWVDCDLGGAAGCYLPYVQR